MGCDTDELCWNRGYIVMKFSSLSLRGILIETLSHCFCQERNRAFAFNLCQIFTSSGQDLVTNKIVSCLKHSHMKSRDILRYPISGTLPFHWTPKVVQKYGSIRFQEKKFTPAINDCQTSQHHNQKSGYNWWGKPESDEFWKLSMP